MMKGSNLSQYGPRLLLEGNPLEDYNTPEKVINCTSKSNKEEESENTQI